MKLALLSDIHANMPALRGVLDSIEAHRPDHVFCLEDLVGYAPWPNEVVDTIRRRHIPTIAGNYDEGVGLDSDECGTRPRHGQPPDDAAHSSGGSQQSGFAQKLVANVAAGRPDGPPQTDLGGIVAGQRRHPRHLPGAPGNGVGLPGIHHNETNVLLPNEFESNRSTTGR